MEPHRVGVVGVVVGVTAARELSPAPGSHRLTAALVPNVFGGSRWPHPTVIVARRLMGVPLLGSAWSNWATVTARSTSTSIATG